MTEIKDHGHREEFDSGSVRDTQDGKGRYDLISPLAMHRLSLILEGGAKKYGDRNWEQGQPISRYISSALRHVSKHMLGLRDEDHLAMALWNLHGAVHTEEMCKAGVLPDELNDAPVLDTPFASRLLDMFDRTVPDPPPVVVDPDCTTPPVV